MIKRLNPTKKAEQKASKIVNAPVTFLDEGENGEVYRTKIDGKIYLVKIFNKKINDYQINYLLTLSDRDFIPTIYELDHKYIIMDYVNAPTLRAVMEAGLTKSQMRSILKAIDIEISKWHLSGYCHGDLNEDNIFVLSNHEVKFIDPDLNRWLDPKHFMEYDLLAIEETEEEMLNYLKK